MPASGVPLPEARRSLGFPPPEFDDPERVPGEEMRQHHGIVGAAREVGRKSMRAGHHGCPRRADGNRLGEPKSSRLPQAAVPVAAAAAAVTALGRPEPLGKRLLELLSIDCAAIEKRPASGTSRRTIGAETIRQVPRIVKNVGNLLPTLSKRQCIRFPITAKYFP